MRQKIIRVLNWLGNIARVVMIVGLSFTVYAFLWADFVPTVEEMRVMIGTLAGVLASQTLANWGDEIDFERRRKELVDAGIELVDANLRLELEKRADARALARLQAAYLQAAQERDFYMKGGR